MSNNTPETITEHQRYCQKCLGKSRWYYEEHKEWSQKMASDRYKALSEEEIKKECMLKVDIRICLKKNKRVWKTM